jgi:uncharacterized protein YkwD
MDNSFYTTQKFARTPTERTPTERTPAERTPTESASMERPRPTPLSITLNELDSLINSANLNPSDPNILRTLEAYYLNEMNAHRQQHGFRPLILDEEINNIAKIAADDLRLGSTTHEGTTAFTMATTARGANHGDSIIWMMEFNNIEDMYRDLSRRYDAARNNDRQSHTGISIWYCTVNNRYNGVMLIMGSSEPPAPVNVEGTTDPTDIRTVEQHLLDFINVERQRVGLSALVSDAELTAAVRIIAKHPNPSSGDHLHNIVMPVAQARSLRFQGHVTHPGLQQIDIARYEETVIRHLTRDIPNQPTHIALAIEWNPYIFNGQGGYVLVVWRFN